MGFNYQWGIDLPTMLQCVQFKGEEWYHSILPGITTAYIHSVPTNDSVNVEKLWRVLPTSCACTLGKDEAPRSSSFIVPHKTVESSVLTLELFTWFWLKVDFCYVSQLFRLRGRCHLKGSTIYDTKNLARLQKEGRGTATH